MTGRRPVLKKTAEIRRSPWRACGALALAAAPALLASRGLALNQPVPELRAADLAGVAHSLKEYGGKATLILFWHPANARAAAAVCGVAALAANYEQAGLATVVSGPAERNSIEAAVAPCERKPAVLVDPGRKAFADYQIVALPTLLVVAPDRTLKFKAAGFGREGMGQAQTALDELYGRPKAAAAAGTAAPEAVRRFAMAQKFLKLGLKAQGVKALEEVTATHPEFRPAWVALGYQRLAGERAEEAGQCFAKAMALDSGASDIAAGMAWLAWKQGRSGEVKAWLDRVPLDDPNRSILEKVRP